MARSALQFEVLVARLPLVITCKVPAALNSTLLLLGHLRPDQTPTRWESDRVRLGIDWDDLVVRAIVLGLAPQFHHWLGQWKIQLPSRAEAKLVAAHQAAARRNAAVFEQVEQALSAFNAHGLRPIVLKGVHLAALVYPDRALRPMNDIDLLFRPEELTQAESILIGLGYSGNYKSANLGAGVTKHVSTFRRESASA